MGAPRRAPPFDLPLASARRLAGLPVVATVTTLLAAGWRRGATRATGQPPAVAD
ncbi:MAG TPA: hypothetical protein VEA69_13480 [Tepidisphaeraceae bacterium]|nr:hypothetical protein [Tepidisphaeraceae bacterium]